jgi:hypothetical protein
MDWAETLIELRMSCNDEEKRSCDGTESGPPWEEEDDYSEWMIMIPPPIPWIFRFPSPGDLALLPTFPGEGKQIRGRPSNWAENLLVYELSQAGMKNKQIAELVLGVEKFYKIDKDPIYVRINTILRTVEKVVSKAYPFPEST